MKKFFTRYDFTLLLCLVLVGVLLWHVHDSRERIQQLEDSIDAGFQEHLRQDEALSLMETKGLLRDHWVGYGGIDETEQTMELNLSLVPKGYDPETKVSVVCNGETLPLEWKSNSGTYRTTLTAPLAESCQVTSVMVTQGEETKQAEVAWELMEHRDFTPRFTSGGFYPDYFSGEEDTCTVAGMIHLSDAGAYAVEVGLGNHMGTLRTLVDGEIVEETPVKWEAFGTMYRAEPEFTVSMVPGQVTECVLVLTDGQGLAYHYTAFRYQAEEPRADFYRAGQEDISTQVYGPKGTLLYTIPGTGSMPDTGRE